jgi:4-diphosphocytidyl-2-C-methyl-D-erythritol kinase
MTRVAVRRRMTTTRQPTLTSAWRSPAKVNLCLRVIGRRDDGYHLLDSIFVPIDLCDAITVQVVGLPPGTPTKVSVACAYPGVPENEENLAARAARAVLAEAGYAAEVTIAIAKTIPPGAGLGGGSGNAATVLTHMNRMLALGLGDARLRELALYLGADVPFFLHALPARVRGIGEDVQPIAGWPNLHMVVAWPAVTIATGEVFRALTPTPEGQRGDEPARLAAGAAPAPNLLVNDLEQVVLPAYPAVAALKRRLLAAGASAAVLSGSGSAVVGLAPSRAAAEEVAAAVRAGGGAAQAHAVGVFAAERNDTRRAEPVG